MPETVRARDAVEGRLHRLALWGAALYVAAGAADAILTWHGLEGATGFEGNPFLRGTMDRIGIVPALMLEKAAVAALCYFVAWRLGRAIHRDEPWIWKIPMSPPVRRWMKRNDRWWIALAPIFAVAAAQAAAAASWIVLMFPN